MVTIGFFLCLSIRTPVVVSSFNCYGDSFLLGSVGSVWKIEAEDGLRTKLLNADESALRSKLPMAVIKLQGLEQRYLICFSKFGILVDGQVGYRYCILCTLIINL
jgi:hypothetical protein